MKFDPTINYGETELSIEENRNFWQFSEFIKTLVILSDNAERQTEIIGRYIVVVTDEMALDFYSNFSLNYSYYLQEGLLTVEQKDKLLEIDNFFTEKSNNSLSDFWDDSQLATNPDWENIRQKSKEVLRLLQMDDLIIEYSGEKRQKQPITDKNPLIQMRQIRLIRKPADK